MNGKRLTALFLCILMVFLISPSASIANAKKESNLPNSFAIYDTSMNGNIVTDVDDFDSENGVIVEKMCVPDIIGYDNALSKGHIARLDEEEKDLYSAIFRNSDGTNTLYMYSDPIKFIDRDGNIKDKSNKIVAKEGGYTNGENDVRAFFPNQINNGVKLSYNDINIIIKPRKSVDSNARIETVSLLEQTEEYICYDEVFGKNTYLTYTPVYMGYKEDIILSEYTGQSEFEFILLTGGLELYKDTSDCEGGSLYLSNDEGEQVASLGQIIIFTADNGNNTFGTYEFETVKVNEEYIIKIKVDPRFLRDSETVYPVTIDPTITINYNNGAGAIHDVTLNSATGSDGSSTVLTVGKHNTYGVRRTLMRFPALNLNSIYPEQITSANVYLRDLMCQTTGMDVFCHAFQGTLNWTENTATWANVNPNSYNASYLSKKTIKYDGTVSYGFSILNAVKNWSSKINGAGYTGADDIRRGVIFKMATNLENSSLVDAKTFGSFNNVTTSYKPYLQVTYNSVTPTVTLNTRNITLLVGQTYQLTATTYPLGQALHWHPYDPGIASVTQNGLVRGVKAGTSKVIVSLINSNANDICTVNVIPGPAPGIISGSSYMLKNNSGYYLDVYNHQTEVGSRVCQYPYTGKANQEFIVQYQSNGEYTIRIGEATNRYLAVDASSNVVLASSSTAASSRWYIVAYGNNYKIINKSDTSKYLGSSTTGAVYLTIKSNAIYTEWSFADYPAFSTMGGLESRTVSIQRVGTITSNNTWLPRINAAIDAWNNSGSNTSITSSTASSSHKIEVKSVPGNSALGWCTKSPSGNVVATSSLIVINTATIAATDASRQSTIAHEIGHLLWLSDNPATSPNNSLMHSSRNRENVSGPQPYDIRNVKFRYD